LSFLLLSERLFWHILSLFRLTKRCEIH
jgi:hypothetical protein